MRTEPISKEEVTLLVHDICVMMDERDATDLGSMMLVVAMLLPARAMAFIESEDRFQRYLNDLMHISLDHFSNAQTLLGKGSSK